MPETPQFVALVGAPRSGTTWLQHLLAADPRVVSPQETSLFSRFVAPLEASWRWQLRGTTEDWARRRFIGLGAVLTEQQFDALVVSFVHGVIGAIRALKPGATVVVEKSPSHSEHVELIARYAPGVRFLHIVRDGRDAASSLVDAGGGWGSAWGAPTTISDAARIWSDYVEGARRAEQFAPYCEVRYEDLRGDENVEHLARVLEFCGVPAAEAAVKERIESLSLNRQREQGVTAMSFGGEAARLPNAGTEPEGFYGQATIGTWAAWPVAERVAFDAQAGGLLRQLGYVGDDAWLGDARAVRRARWEQIWRARASRVVSAAGRRLERAGARIERPI